MVARQSLTLFVKVRILVPQPNPGSLKEVRGFFCVYTKNQGGTLVFRPGFYSVSGRKKPDPKAIMLSAVFCIWQGSS